MKVIDDVQVEGRLIMIIELDGLVDDIRHACNHYDDELVKAVLDGIRNSAWLAGLDERLIRAETGITQVLDLHQQQEKPTRHWEPCEDHIPSPENRRAAGGWIALENAMRTCTTCTYTEHYHCTHDAHDSCGHDDYPCVTARAAQGSMMSASADD